MILPKFPKNCMKLKEFGPPGGGGASPAPPLDPPLNLRIFPLCHQSEGKNLCSSDDGSSSLGIISFMLSHGSGHASRWWNFKMGYLIHIINLAVLSNYAVNLCS